MKQYPVYLEKFPKIANINEPVGMAHDNHVTDNLFVNSQKEIPLYEGDEKLANEDENNLMVNEFEDFLDEEKGNYAIKKDAEILNTHPGLGEISLDDIGVSEDVIKKVNELLGRDIVRLFPRNGAENVNSAKAEFMWTKSDIYDKYRIIIADDPEMKNIVEDEIVSYNYYSTNRLEPGIKTYYWTVTGIDISKENFEDLPSVGKPYKLMTSKYENSDKIILEETIKKANDLLGTLSEGDEAGQCAEGTISDFKSVIERAETVNKEKLASQSEVDIMAEELSLAITKVTASRKAGYLSIEDYLNNQEGWFAGDKVYEEGIMHVEGVEYGYYEASELPGYQLLKFKMKADFTGEWTGFGLRQQTPGMAYSNGGVGYMIIIKENNIEFQRYNNGGGMIKNIENNCIKPGEWHEYEVGAIDVLGGIRVILRVDGKSILNELDTDGVITEPGHFQVYNRLSSAEHYSNYFELAVSDDEITEFDNSILTGKLSPEEPELVDGFDKLFPAGSEPEIINGIVRRGENSVSFKAESGAEYGTLSCGGIEGNEVFNMRIKFNISEGWQGIGMRADECEGLPWTIENYLFIVKKDVVELQRVSGEGITFLALYPNEYIKDGEFTELTFGAYPTDKGMRIMVYSGENKIIDYTDVYSKHASLRVNFYDRNGKGMEFER